MRAVYQTSVAIGLLLLATLVAAAVVEIRQSTTRREEATAHDKGSRMVVRSAFFAGYAAASVAVNEVPTADIHRGMLALAVALILIWSGLAIRWWAFRALGRYFTFTVMTSSDQTIVTNGPYRLIRHPGYAGLLLALAGGGLAFGNWLSLAAMVVLPLVGVIYRIRIEEAALLDALGDDYRSYASGRKRLIPFVW